MARSQLQNDLVDACYYGNHRRAEKCLQDGANPNKPDDRGYYPLHMACQEGHLRIVALLARHHADLDLKDAKGKGEPPLFRAVGGHLRTVRFLINGGCNVNLRRGGPKGDTALHIACAYGKFRITVELVRAGARIGALDEEGKTPSHYAIAGRFHKIADFLATKCPNRL